VEIIVLAILATALLAFAALGVEDTAHNVSIDKKPRRRIDVPVTVRVAWDESLPRRRPLQWDSL